VSLAVGKSVNLAVGETVCLAVGKSVDLAVGANVDGEEVCEGGCNPKLGSSWRLMQ